MWSCRPQSGFNGVTDRSFGTASDLCFIISTRHWYLTPCGSGCWPAPNPHDAPRRRKRRCVWVPTAASVHKGVKLFALNIPLLVRAMSSTTSLLQTDESLMRWSSYICHCEGLAFSRKTLYTSSESTWRWVCVEMSLSIIQWYAVSDVFLTYMLRWVYDLCSHLADFMCLPLLPLNDSLIIPVIFVWVDSSHLDVWACQVAALPPCEEISHP